MPSAVEVPTSRTESARPLERAVTTGTSRDRRGVRASSPRMTAAQGDSAAAETRVGPTVTHPPYYRRVTPKSHGRGTIVLPDLRINAPRLEPDPVLLEQLSQLSSASAARRRDGPHGAFPDVGGHRRGRRGALLADRHPARRRLAVRPAPDAPADPSAGSARRRPASSPVPRRTWSRPGRPSCRRDRRSRTRTTATTPARPNRTRTTATTPARPNPTRTTATTPARPSPTRTTATTPARPSPTRTTATTPARPSPTRTAATRPPVRTPVRSAGQGGGQGGGQANGHRS